MPEIKVEARIVSRQILLEKVEEDLKKNKDFPTGF